MVRLLFLYYSIWLNPEAGNMNRILCSDWLPGRARWARLSSTFPPPFPLLSFWPSLFGRDCWILAPYVLSFFLFLLRFYWRPEFVSIHKNTKNNDQYPAILTLRFALAFPYPKSWIHNLGLAKYLFQDLRTPNSRRRKRHVSCTLAFGVARVVCRETYMNLTSANENA